MADNIGAPLVFTTGGQVQKFGAQHSVLSFQRCHPLPPIVGVFCCPYAADTLEFYFFVIPFRDISEFDSIPINLVLNVPYLFIQFTLRSFLPYRAITFPFCPLTSVPV